MLFLERNYCMSAWESSGGFRKGREELKGREAPGWPMTAV
jgi:hypothetical protein